MTVTKDDFADEFAELAYEAGIEDTCKLEFPSYMAERNRQDPRSFAEVDPWDLHFCFAPQILRLPDDQRRGVMMHEIGHVLCRDLPNGGTERDADVAAMECFGIVIEYDCRWPGKGLQTAIENPVRTNLEKMRIMGYANPVNPSRHNETYRGYVIKEDREGMFEFFEPGHKGRPGHARTVEIAKRFIDRALDGYPWMKNPVTTEFDPQAIAERFVRIVGTSAEDGGIPITRTQDSAQTIADGYEAGAIRNAELKDAKDRLNRAWEKAWEERIDAHKKGWKGDTNEKVAPADDAFIEYFPHYSLHDTIAAQKRFDKLVAKPGKKAIEDYHGDFSLNDVDPALVKQVRRILAAAEPMASMLKAMKSMIVKGRKPQEKTAAQKKAEATKAAGARECAVCFGEFQTYKDGRPARHGFNIVGGGYGEGHLGAYHTGPCFGFEYPHYGLAPDGTKEAKRRAGEQLVQIEATIANLEDAPTLAWAKAPDKWEAKRGAEVITVELEPGDSETTMRNLPGYGTVEVPSYDSYWKMKMAGAQNRRDNLKNAIAFYDDKIAAWSYQP